MLVEFKVTNFRSFREEQTLSLVAGAAARDRSHPDSLIDCEKLKLLKTAAVYGANASGKSNLIKAVNVMATFVRISATQINIGDPVPRMVPFRLDAESPLRPSSFEVTVLIEGTQYEYGFSATSERVHDEWLCVGPPGGKMVPWLDRRFDPDSDQTTWAIDGPLKADGSLLRERTRPNGLLLSRGAELNVESLLQLYLWFGSGVGIHDLSDSPVVLTEMTAMRAQKDDGFRNRVLRMLRDADLGIDGVDVFETDEMVIPDGTPKSERRLLEALRESLQTLGRVFGKGEMKMHPVATTPRLRDSEHTVTFSLEQDESNGTRRLFALAGPVLEALDEGRLLVLDELECSMHPLLAQKLIALFQSSTANMKGAQLVFASHDTTLMHPALFRRDQIWLVEKNRGGATQLFSLYDFDTPDRPRATEAFQKNYLAGRYGGVPMFGRMFEDQEIR